MSDQQLWKIADEYLELSSMLDDGDDEAVKNTLELVDHNLQDKIDNICNLISAWTATEETLSNEIKRLQARRKLFENRKQRLKGYLLFQIKRLNKPSVETEHWSVRVQKGRESLVVDDINQIPDKYLKVTTTVDKTLLKRDADAMHEKMECAGFHMERGEDYVVIK